MTIEQKVPVTILTGFLGSGEVKESNYGTNEKYKIDRVLDLINAPKNAAHAGKQVFEKYNAKYLKDVPTGGRGREQPLEI